MERWLSVSADSLVAGRAVVEADGREIVVLRRQRVHAFDNACPHQGNPLVDGEVLGDVLECAYHGWRFDLAPARAWSAEPARRYPVELVDGELRVRLA